MNYFELYPGDYRRDTARLSLAEHGAYLLLLADYYASETPLPADVGALCRIAGAQGGAEQKAVKAVAEQFFPIGEDGLRHNGRADLEIAKAQKRISAARRNGANGGRKPRGDGPGTQPADNPPGIPAGIPAGTQPVTQWGAQQGTHSGEALHTPHARPHAVLQTSPQSGTSPGLDTHRGRECAQPPASADEVAPGASPTAAGEACRAMRQAGLPNANPAHPELQALIAAGATTAQFTQAAAVAVKRGKGFAYAIGVLRGQLADAASTPKPGKTAGSESAYIRNQAVAAAWLAEASIDEGETP